MNRISIKTKKKVINLFLNKLNLMLKNFNISWVMLEFISTRKLIKLFKLYFSVENKKYDKKQLKIFCKFIIKTNFTLADKKYINSYFKTIVNYDVYDFANKFIENMDELIRLFENSEYFKSPIIDQFFQKTFIEKSRILII